MSGTETSTFQEAVIIEGSEFTQAQTTVPIYRLITPVINESVFIDRASTLFRAVGEVEEYEGIYLTRVGNTTFEMDSSDGSMRFAKYAKLWNLSLGEEVPTPEECKIIADTFLTDLDLLPEGALFLGSGAGNVTAFSPTTEEVRKKTLHHQVNYGFVKDDYPVSETTASISVIVGAEGEVLYFDWSWREMELVTESILLSLDEVCLKYKLNPSDVEDAPIIIDGTVDSHWTAPFAGPTYHIQLESDYEGDPITTLLNIPATEFSPWVTIITPSDGAHFRPGETVSFNCSVRFGEAPYTYLWSSNVDGELSTEQAFSTSELSALYSEERNLGQIISVTVVDANGLVATDWISVQIARGDFLTDYTLELVIGVGIIVVLGLVLLSRKKSGALVLLLMLLVFMTFLVIPQSMVGYSAQSSAKDFETASEGDDNTKEVGIEWIGLTGLPPLPFTEQNIEGFYNWMGILGGHQRTFNWGEYAAWEEDFKYEAIGGTDYDWVDAVDFVYYQGHGNPNGVFFSSQHDSMFLDHSEAKWGDGDLEWIVLDACEPLEWENGIDENVFQRWGPALQGVHMICSFSTGSLNAQIRGARFGMYLTFPFFRYTIKQAWFQACADTEGSATRAAILYATKSPDPWNPKLDDPVNDHAHGFGYVSSDPTPATTNWWVWLTTQC